MMIYLWKKTLEMHVVVIVITSVSNDNNKCYPEVFFDERLYKLAG